MCRFEHIIGVELVKRHWRGGLYVVVTSSQPPHKVEVRLPCCPWPRCAGMLRVTLNMRGCTTVPAQPLAPRDLWPLGVPADCARAAVLRDMASPAAPGESGCPVQFCEMPEIQAQELVAEVLDCVARV